MRGGAGLVGTLAVVAFTVAAVAMPAPPAGAQQDVTSIVILGDSITEGDDDPRSDPTFRRSLHEQLDDYASGAIDFVGTRTGTCTGDPLPGGWDQDHEGHAGYRTGEILNGRPAGQSFCGRGPDPDERLATWAPAWGVVPDVVVIHLGTNDVRNGTAEGVTLVNLRAIVREIGELVEAGEPPIDVVLAQIIPNGFEDKTRRVNRSIGSMDWTAVPGVEVHVVDLNSGYDPAWNYDGIHPGPAGQAFIADRLFEAVAPFVPAGPPALRLGDVTVAETDADRSVTVPVTLAGPAPAEVRLAVELTGGTATVGDDITLDTTRITLAAGDRGASIGLTVRGDDVSEPTETATVTVSLLAGTANLTDPSATVTISDDDELDPGGTGDPDPPAGELGYLMLGAGGVLYPFGDVTPLATTGAAGVDVALTADGDGAWVLGADGGVRVRGTARSFGDLTTAGVALRPGETPSALSVTPADDGYWIFTDRGRALAFGAAVDHGDLFRVTGPGGRPVADVLNGPVIASVATPTGDGYYMIGSDGGVFSFGDAEFHGSTGSLTLNQPVVGIAPDPDGSGYWLAAADGGIFAFDAPFLGSLPAIAPVLNQPVVGAIPFGSGYLMVAADGGIFNFSDLAFLGSLGGTPLPAPIVAVAAFASR